MKRGTPRHPKTYELAEALKVPHTQAVGILNMLWEHAGEQTPRGDIGALPDSAIALACEWAPKKAPQLVAALIASRWVDRHEQHRLIIHDWPHHCEYEVYRKLKKNSKDFLECYGDLPGRFPEESGKSPVKVPASREAMAKAQAFVFCSEEKRDVEILRPPPDVVSVLEELKEIYHRAGVPVAPRHEQLCIQLLIGLHPSKLWKVLDYVKWQLLKGHWRDSRTTKRLLNLLRDGDYDVELVERTLPKVSEKSSAEERHERFVAAVEQRIGTV